MDKIYNFDNPLIVRVGLPGPGNAYHKYTIKSPSLGDEDFAVINFQEGAIDHAGVNGCQSRDLIEIMLDQLMAFQTSNFSCRENALIITKLQEALHWIDHRTKDRVRRGVEGTHAK